MSKSQIMDINYKAFSEILNEVYFSEILCTKEIAAAMQVSEGTVHDYRNDRTEPSYSRIVSLNKELMKRGYFKLARVFQKKSNGIANGRLDDEMADMVEIMGKMITHYNLASSGNENAKRAFFDGFEVLKEVMKNVEAEGQAL